MCEIGLPEQMSEEQSRYIPSGEDKKVKEKHFFECAWCGIRLFDRHHIFEFRHGGPNTADNLILLCPNCHRRTISTL